MTSNPIAIAASKVRHVSFAWGGWLALLLSLPAAAADAPDVSASDAPAEWVKSVIGRDWAASVTQAGTVVVASPRYAMAFKRGCVIHRLHFQIIDGQPSLGDMVSDDQYFVFAADEACAVIDTARFFGIEPGNDVEGLLSFAKGLQQGPRRGRDRVSDSALATIAQCFPATAEGTTRVVRAHSWRASGSNRYQYQATLSCKAIEDAGEIVAVGTRGEDAVAWELKAWHREVVMPAEPGKP